MPRTITKNTVTLTLMKAGGEPIANMSLSRSDYDKKKSGLSALTDAEYRRARGVRFLRGRIYEKGDVVEEFVRGFDADGREIGVQSLRLDGLVLRNIAHAKRAMRKLIRRHQEAPPSFRRALVRLTKREMAKGRTIVAVARELGMPSPTLTRWVANLTPKKPAKKRTEEEDVALPSDSETCLACLAMERGLI